MGTIVLFQPTGRRMDRWQGFYTSSQVARLAGVSHATLRRWRERGIITPSAEIVSSDDAVSRGYSYADLVIIRILVALSQKHLNLKEAAWALRHIYERLGPPDRGGWAVHSVLIAQGRILVDLPDEWGITDATMLGQKVETRVLGELVDELRDLEIGHSIVVPRQFRPYVQIDPRVMGGDPCIRGYRLQTSVVSTMLTRYGSMAKVTKLYPQVPKDLLEQAVEYETFLDERAA